jgi:hypothetical protein
MKDFCHGFLAGFWGVFAGFLGSFWMGFWQVFAYKRFLAVLDFWHYIRLLYSTFIHLLPIRKGKALLKCY